MIRRLINLASNPSLPSSSTLTNRSASSFPLSASQSSSCKSSLAGRGRFKPMKGGSVTARLVAARQSREKQAESSTSTTPRMGRGRTKARRHTLSSSPINRMPTISLGSATQALHLGLTPSHLPLPIPLGTEQYFAQPGSSINSVPTPSQWLDYPLGPFDPSIADRSILHGDINAMVKANGDAVDGHRSALNDHLHVMYALARPGRSQHLGRVGTYDADFFDADLPSLTSSLTSAINEAGARHALAAESEWNNILAKMDGRSIEQSDMDAQNIQVSAEEKGAVDEAVLGLSAVLEGMKVESTIAQAKRSRGSSGRMIAVVGEDGDEEWIRMDSTRRKRKKKINKHKFKKRRKAQRALRKKLGK